MNAWTNSRRVARKTAHMKVWAAMFVLCLLAATTRPARAVTQLKRNVPAPEITLKEMGGTEISTAKFRGRVIILIFGELYHEKTRQAYDQIDAALQDTRLSGESIVPLMVAAQHITEEDLRTYAGQKLPALILHDPDRKAFGDYQVAAMPSVVIIDKEGRVVHAMAGLTTRFSDIVTDSLLLAAGKLSAERFEQTLNPQPTTKTAESEKAVRAGRVALLARQLARRGLDELAAEKYAEALALDEHQATAHLELGALMLKSRRLEEAEKQFRIVLTEQPESVQARLGVAFVQTLRGGTELVEAEKTVRDVLARSSAQARAHYLLGLILEQRGKTEDAAASFKKAAQLLLERNEQE